MSGISLAEGWLSLQNTCDTNRATKLLLWLAHPIPGELASSNGLFAMSKVTAIALNSASLATLAIDAVRDNNVAGLVNKTVVSYHTMSGVLHQAACAALFHAAQTGDSRPLSALHAGLRKNDADALRIWVGKRTVVEVMQDDKELQIPYVTFKKDAGFAIKKGTENYRVGHHELESLLAGPSFQDVNQKAEAVYDLKKLIAFLARVEKQADKKAEENGFEVPSELMGAIRSLTAASNKVAATLN